MDALGAWLAQLDFSHLIDMAVLGCACLLCISFHEMCHGLAALALGDPTAKRAGRLTLNPLKHVDLVGLILLLTARFGWAKPVPVDAGNFRNPKLGMVLTALAGPMSNVLLSAVAAACSPVCFYCLMELDLPFFLPVVNFCLYVFTVSAGLAVFNLLPIPPLDGSKVLLALLPRKWYWKIMRYEHYGMIALVVLMLTGAMDSHLSFLQQKLLHLLNPISGLITDLLLTL